MDPTIICNKGRSQEDFIRDGTGYVLYFQNGLTPEHFDVAPLTAAEAEKDVRAYGKLCMNIYIYSWKLTHLVLRLFIYL